MMRFYFKRGLRYRELQTVWELRRRLATGKLQFENEQGEIKALSDAEVLSLWHKSEWVIDESSLGSQAEAIYLATSRDLSTFPEKWQKRAMSRLHYINAVKPDQIKFNPEVWNKLIKTAAADINDPKPPAPNTVHKWWVKYRTTKSVTKLIPKNIEGFQRQRDYRYVIFEEVISQVYLTLQKPPKIKIARLVNDKIKQINLGKSSEEQIRSIHQSTVYRWIDQLHQDIVDASRLGAEAARTKYRIALGGLKVSNILERVEIDHSPLDLIVIDRNTNLPLGRPWMSLAIDKHS